MIFLALKISSFPPIQKCLPYIGVWEKGSSVPWILDNLSIHLSKSEWTGGPISTLNTLNGALIHMWTTGTPPTTNKLGLEALVCTVCKVTATSADAVRRSVRQLNGLVFSRPH